MLVQETQGLRVLVAEDERLTALVIEEVLLAVGHSVTLAEDGAVALAMAVAEPFDVLVTDLAMPNLDGLQLIARLGRHHPMLPVVVMTGYLDPAAAVQLRERAQPPVALLHKPFRVEALTDALAGIRPAPRQCRLG